MGKTNLYDVNTSIEVTTYGELEKITDTLSKCRLRVFYKGLSRNRTYFSDDFCNQLISSLPYAPIKGIFNYGNDDFEGHGKNNDEGRIYGIVPEQPNAKWEVVSEDNDREYLCCDVYLFTALYDEAKMIKGKSQSMEIYRETMEGEWKIWEDGKPYFHFYKGGLIGLQILGDDTEPCFEQSGFYSLKQDFEQLINFTKKEHKEENNMNIEQLLFKLSDGKKRSMLFEALNPKFNEQDNWEINYWICDVYDEYALCEGADGKMQRVYYSKNADDTVTIGDTVDTYVVDVTESEKIALDLIQATGNGSFEKANEELAANAVAVTEYTDFKEKTEQDIKDFELKIEELNTVNSDFAAKVEEFETQIEGLNKTIEEKVTDFEKLELEKSELENEKVVLNSELENITNERNNLFEFKSNIDKNEKLKLLDEVGTKLSETTITSFSEKIETMSVEEFSKELLFTVHKENPTIFSAETEGYIYKNNDGKENETGVSKLIHNYKNKQGGNK